MSKTWVIIICIVALLALGAFDYYLYTDDIPGNSITQIIRSFVTVSALVPGAIGFVGGFLFSHFMEGIGYGPKAIFKSIKGLVK